MATQRYISTSFWDDEWIQTLDPSEKLLYLYLMTNPLTTISGAYKIALRRMVFDTGFNEETVKRILVKFQKAKKAYHYEEYMILPSWPKHQKWQIKDTIKKGIEADLAKIPENVKSYMVYIGYAYPMPTVQVPPELFYSDIDPDIDPESDTDTKSDSIPTPAVAEVEPKTKAVVKAKPEPDPLYTAIFQSFIGKSGAFTNYPKEAQAIKRIIKYCEQHAPRYTEGDKIKLAELAITKYFELTQNGDRFWRGQPFTPSNLSASGIFDRVLIEIGQTREEAIANDIPF